MEFKYRTKFTCNASIKRVTPSKEALASVGLESLKDLRSLAWSDEDISKSPDILVWVANFAVPNVANLNGHLIDTATALRVGDSMKNKPVNCEHDRSYIIGCVTNVGFSSYNDNKLIEKSEVDGDKPFNIAAAGIIWKVADRYMANMLQECNDKDSYMYEKISTSWEIGYNSYKILRGSRNISMGEVIEDEKEIEKLSPYLMDNGGTGLDDEGRELYTIITGDDAIFLGLALTPNPAAAVKGVGIVMPDEMDEEEMKKKKKEMDKEMKDKKASPNFQEIDDNLKTVDKEFSTSAADLIDGLKRCKDQGLDDEKAFKSLESAISIAKLSGSSFKESIDGLLAAVATLNSENKEKSQNFNKKISQTEKLVVKAGNNMKFNDFPTMFESLEVAEASSVTKRQLREFVEDQIADAGKQYKALEEAKAAQEKELKETLEKAKESEAKVNELVDQIKNLQAEAEKAQKNQVFNDRMSALAEIYDLENDKVRKKVTKEISNLSDADYNSWLEDDASVYLVKKASKEDEAKAKEEAATKALQEAEASKKHVPNATEGEKEDKPTKRKEWKLGEDFAINQR